MLYRFCRGYLIGLSIVSVYWVLPHIHPIAQVGLGISIGVVSITFLKSIMQEDK